MQSSAEHCIAGIGAERRGHLHRVEIQGARVVVIDGSGHNMMGEQPDRVLDALLAFLK